jgi:hypothetical protein
MRNSEVLNEKNEKSPQFSLNGAFAGFPGPVLQVRQVPFL